MAEQQNSSTFGCLLIAVFIVLAGYYGLGGDDDEPKPQPTTPSFEKPPVIDPAALKGVEVDIGPRSRPVGSNMLEQAIIDGLVAPATGSTAGNARDFVGATINSAGYLCARAVEAQKAASDMYGVGCVTHSEGAGHANYLINTRTGSVSEI